MMEVVEYVTLTKYYTALSIKLDRSLKKFGLTKSKYDQCVYFKEDKNGLLIVSIYVDDVIIFCSNESLTNNLKKHLHNEFSMKDLGAISHCLGNRVTRTSKEIFIDQAQYIEQILDKLGMRNCKPVGSPMNVSEKVSTEDSPKNEDEKSAMQSIPFREAVGCLMYLAQCTRPDICFAVNKLSRYSSNPGLKHWAAVKHLMRFLQGTKNHKLCYRKRDGQIPDIIGFSDADWASDSDNRKSTTGYTFVCQGGAISWGSRKQPTVALSSCEAEYMAISAGLQEAIWWHGLRREINGSQSTLELRTL